MDWLLDRIGFYLHIGCEIIAKKDFSTPQELGPPVLLELDSSHIGCDAWNWISEEKNNSRKMTLVTQETWTISADNRQADGHWMS